MKELVKYISKPELQNPARQNYFRKIAAMNALVEILGPDAMQDLMPYLGHEYWRVRHRAQALTVDLRGAGVTRSLLSRLRHPDIPADQAAAILSVLAERGDTEALPVARATATARRANDATGDAVSASRDAVVRAAAVRAVGQLGGANELKTIFSCLRDSRHPLELEACETAVLSLREDPTNAKTIRQATMSALSKWDPPVRHSLYWILAQLGDPQSLDALKDAADKASDVEFREIIYALSWSPDEQASKLLLTIIQENLETPRAQVTAREAVRRMVVGPDGMNNLTTKQRLDFADPLLRMVRNEAMTAYLGTIHSGRSAQILQRVMRQGGVTTIAAESIISATTGMEKAPAADRKLAAAALIDAIEFIEVNYLRGGVAAVLKKSKDAQGAYARWKTLSAQAGKNLLKLDNPGKPAIVEFDDLDLDF